MKKFSRFTLASMFVIALATSAFATDSGPYVGVTAGASIPADGTFKDVGGNVDVKYDAGYAIGVSAGYTFNALRVEGEIGYKSADTSKVFVTSSVDYESTISNLSFMANAFYDIKTPYTFGIVPYVGAGIGVSILETTDGIMNDTIRTIKKSNDTVFAYQVAVGAGYPVTKNITMDIGYRYFATTEATLKTSVATTDKISFESHNILAGIRYNF